MIDQNVRGLAMTWAVQTLRSRPIAGSYAINKGGILDTDPTYSEKSGRHCPVGGNNLLVSKLTTGSHKLGNECVAVLRRP